MRIFYITPSIIPSRAANVVHVLSQVDGFSSLGYEVFIYFQRKIISNKKLILNLKRDYLMPSQKIKYKSFYSPFNFASSLLITILALPILLYRKECLIISRNLYGAFFYGLILRRNLVYETHNLEDGFKRHIQLALLKSNLIKKVVITKALKLILEKQFNKKFFNIHVLPDAAKSGSNVVNFDQKRIFLKTKLPFNIESFKFVCGYFGHLYKGRGIEIIMEIARKMPEIFFLVYGGNLKQIKEYQNQNIMQNLKFMGYCSHQEVTKISRLVDVLLMPYQKNVSIGLSGSDTSSWMSPMKMFEYMSTGVPIISSDLPVLREILKDSVNCLLSIPNDVESWVENIIKLKNNKSLGLEISKKAFEDYKTKYTWKIRAKRLIEVYEN